MAALDCSVMAWAEGTFLPEVGSCHPLGPDPHVEQVSSLSSVASPAAPSLGFPFQKFLILKLGALLLV